MLDSTPPNDMGRVLWDWQQCQLPMAMSAMVRPWVLTKPGLDAASSGVLLPQLPVVQCSQAQWQPGVQDPQGEQEPSG